MTYVYALTDRTSRIKINYQKYSNHIREVVLVDSSDVQKHKITIWFEAGRGSLWRLLLQIGCDFFWSPLPFHLSHELLFAPARVHQKDFGALESDHEPLKDRKGHFGEIDDWEGRFAVWEVFGAEPLIQVYSAHMESRESACSRWQRIWTWRVRHGGGGQRLGWVRKSEVKCSCSDSGKFYSCLKFIASCRFWSTIIFNK